MKGNLLFVSCFVLMLAGILFVAFNDPLLSRAAQAPAESSQKVPDDMLVRMKNNLLDQARLQNELLQMAQRYQADQQAIQKDMQEMEGLKVEALDKSKLDRATHDVDPEKGVFIAKATPAAPSKPIAPPDKPEPKK